MNALRAILEWVWAILKWVWAQFVLVILVALLIGLGLLAIFVVVEVSDSASIYRFFDEEEETKKFRVLEYLGVGMGGVLLAIGAAVANRRAKAMEKTAEAQADANKGAEAGRRQERLKNAIEHLGHESDSVRLGGAYELFHLARDTEDLRQTVMDILCAHIRRTTGEDGYREKHKSKPSEEVQSLLNLLFVQEHVVFSGCRIDLQGSRLNGASLASARLQGADLSGAQLRGANLFVTKLQSASLPRAQLQEADLTEVELQEANLSGAQLQEANLSWAQLQRANLSKAQLQRADLYITQLQGADLSWGELQGASLSRARLQEANFYEAQLQGVNLDQAQLQGANLYKSHLQGANLYEAHLQGANLYEAHLQGVICQFGGDLSFEERIRAFEEHIRVGIGRKDDLSEVTFAGGLSREDVDSLVKGSFDEAAKSLRRVLEPHIDELASNELPKDSGAIVGAYTEEEAERWIAEYREATGKG